MFSKIGSATLVALALATAALTPACSAPVSSSEEVSEEGSDEIVSKTARFETFVGQDGQTYFHLVAGNGQNVLRSEGYASLAGAKNGMGSVVQNGVDAQQYEILQASNGEYYFNLLAANKEIIGTSQLYSTKSNATRGASTVRQLVNVLGQTPAVQEAPHAVRFEIFTGEDKKSYFHLRAGNGEIVLQSQGYTTKSSAQNGVSSVQTNGSSAARYELVAQQDGQFSFHLKAANGQIIARGESYASKSNAQRGIDTCVKILSAGNVTAQ